MPQSHPPLPSQLPPPPSPKQQPRQSLPSIPVGERASSTAVSPGETAEPTGAAAPDGAPLTPPATNVPQHDFAATEMYRLSTWGAAAPSSHNVSGVPPPLPFPSLSSGGSSPALLEERRMNSLMVPLEHRKEGVHLRRAWCSRTRCSQLFLAWCRKKMSNDAA